MLEDSVKTIRNGEIVQGTVIDVKEDEIILNIGYKADGIITKNEYSNDASLVLTDAVHVGDTMEAKVLKVNDGEGQVTLTYKRLAAEKGNKRLEEAFENQEVLKAPVTQVLDGGLCVNVDEARVFIPASLVSDTYEKDLSKYADQEIEFVITEFNPRRRRIIGNRKQLLLAEKAEKQKELMERIHVGDTVEGTVKNVTDFGAFIDLGGADGLLHISEMSWGRVENPKKVFTVGDKVKVLIKEINGEKITFLDTPGHEAFTAMRARGAKVTDIAIIIVAADDNVMPQTIEAINHASAAGVPIVFAINKIDKPHANPEKIKEELANMNYLVEDWGGKYQSQEISAKKGIGVEELLEKVLLEADLLDLKANPKKRAVGSIIESSLDKGRGYVSTILVENGTLKMGDIVLAGTHQGRIKAMFNERNQRVEKAGPSEPVLILGLNGAPQAGDTFNVLETEQEAREIANRREQLQRELGLRTQKMLTLDDIGRRIAVGNFQELNVIVKGDVDGSVEALSDSLIRLSTEEIQVNVIHKAVGQISESDVVLAAASNAIIIGFQVRPSLQARRNAEKEGVEIRLYSIIYDAIEEVKSAMEGMLSPEIKEEITAYVEVQQVFKITKVGTVAGCMVKEGKIKRTNKIRLIRDGIVIYAGELGSLKRFKDDAKEVVAGLDCGLNITNFNDIQVGDMIEAYEETEIKKTL